MTGPSPFLPWPQHAASDTKGGLRTFAAGASFMGARLEFGHSAWRSSHRPCCDAAVRSEPKAAGFRSRPSLTQRTDLTFRPVSYAAAQPRKPPFFTRAPRFREPMNELRTFPTPATALDWRSGCGAAGKGGLAGLAVERMRLPEHCCPSGLRSSLEGDGYQGDCKRAPQDRSVRGDRSSGRSDAAARMHQAVHPASRR